MQNLNFAKMTTKKRILMLLRQNPLSRADLARETGLTRAAITQIAEEMLQDGFIREAEKAQTGQRGRAPTLLNCCPEAFYAVGVHLHRKSRTKDGTPYFDCLGCTVGITDFSGKPLCQQQLEFPEAATAERCLSMVADLVLQQCKKHKIPAQKLLGIGVSAPGPVDAEKGTLRNPPALPQWHHCPIGALLEEKTGLPVSLEKDTDADALYNHQMSNRAIGDNFLLLGVGFGVGSSVISGGTLLRSPGGFTPELGHVSIDLHGPVCSCGRQGCLELYASTPRLLQKYPQYETWSQLVDSPDGDDALEMLSEYLAAGILNLSNLVRVDTILLGGDILYGFKRIKGKLGRKLSGLSLGHSEVELLPALPQKEHHVQSAANIVFVRYLEGWEG